MPRSSGVNKGSSSSTPTPNTTPASQRHHSGGNGASSRSATADTPLSEGAKPKDPRKPSQGTQLSSEAPTPGLTRPESSPNIVGMDKGSGSGRGRGRHASSSSAQSGMAKKGEGVWFLYIHPESVCFKRVQPLCIRCILQLLLEKQLGNSEHWFPYFAVIMSYFPECNTNKFVDFYLTYPALLCGSRLLEKSVHVTQNTANRQPQSALMYCYLLQRLWSSYHCTWFSGPCKQWILMFILILTSCSGKSWASQKAERKVHSLSLLELLPATYRTLMHGIQDKRYVYCQVVKHGICFSILMLFHTAKSHTHILQVFLQRQYF
jgi:hypothetical protein